MPVTLEALAIAIDTACAVAGAILVEAVAALNTVANDVLVTLQFVASDDLDSALCLGSHVVYSLCEASCGVQSFDASGELREAAGWHIRRSRILLHAASLYVLIIYDISHIVKPFSRQFLTFFITLDI